jgi:hypothetical protein
MGCGFGKPRLDREANSRLWGEAGSPRGQYNPRRLVGAVQRGVCDTGYCDPPAGGVVERLMSAARRAKHDQKRSHGRCQGAAALREMLFS